jgi:HK97 gp10 family phage protein
MPRLSIEGLPELIKTLEALPKATARNTLKRVLTKAAQPTLHAMKANAPRDTGWTAGSIAVSGTLNPANRRDAKREGKSFAEVYVGSTRGSAAVLQEYGTVNQPPHPYMRPAWESTKGQALAIIETELGAAITKSAARYAKKMAKG